jgi:hypothetical protein
VFQSMFYLRGWRRWASPTIYGVVGWRWRGRAGCSMSQIIDVGIVRWEVGKHVIFHLRIETGFYVSIFSGEGVNGLDYDPQFR